MAEDSEMDMEHLVAADVMTVNPVVVSLDATLEEADLILRSTYVTGIPVVDGDGVLVGVIGHANLAWHRFGRRMPSSERGSPKSGSTRLGRGHRSRPRAHFRDGRSARATRRPGSRPPTDGASPSQQGHSLHGDERDAFGLHGLLPPGVATIDEQLASSWSTSGARPMTSSGTSDWPPSRTATRPCSTGSSSRTSRSSCRSSTRRPSVWRASSSATSSGARAASGSRPTTSAGSTTSFDRPATTSA